MVQVAGARWLPTRLRRGVGMLWQGVLQGGLRGGLRRLPLLLDE